MTVRVLLVRPATARDDDADLLARAGCEVVADPYLVVAPSADPGARQRAREALAAIADGADWLIVASRNAIGALAELTSDAEVTQAVTAGSARGLRVAAVGEATAAAVRQFGATHVLLPEAGTGAALAQAVVAQAVVAQAATSSAVLPRGNQAMRELPAILRQAGWTVDDPVVYETSTIAVRPSSADLLADGFFDAVVVRSPSAVRAVHEHVRALPASTVVVCGGPTTAGEAERLGLATIVQSPGPDAHSVARAVVEAIESGERA